ncbi:MAG: helix-turn-helix domain-containing protein [Gaiellaceae bacterium]
MKTEQRDTAVVLRREQGLSVREIAARVDVSRSTASVWLRGIPLTDHQRTALLERNPAYNGQARGAAVNAARARGRRQQWQVEGRARASATRFTWLVACSTGRKDREIGGKCGSQTRILRRCCCSSRSSVRRSLSPTTAFWCTSTRTMLSDSAKSRIFAVDTETSEREPLEDDRQCLLEVYVSQAAQHAPLRHLPCDRVQHEDRANHLRLDSGVGGFERPEWLG